MVQKLRTIKVHYAHIFVTERCNLRCDYCFFRHKHGRDISWEAVERFLRFLRSQDEVPHTFVFSGGEPLMAKELLFRILNATNRLFKGVPLHIQTNGSLIDKEAMIKLRDMNVSLEFGIDGTAEQTLRYRKGLTPASFRRLTDTIQRCAAVGIPCCATMPVHPHELEHMHAGLVFLREHGIHHVDMTPDGFMPWSRETVALFKKNYLGLLRDPLLRQMIGSSESYDWIRFGAMDLSLHPPGYLLGGSPFLCLPEDKRIAFDLWDASTGRIKQDALNFYLDAYARAFGKRERLAYREFNCHNLEFMNQMMGYEYLNTWAVNGILRFLVKTQLKLRIKNKGHVKSE